MSNIMAIKINDAAARSEPRDNCDSTGGPEVSRHDDADGIDWSKAAPSWVSMFTGLVLPLLGFLLLVGSFDVGLSWLFERWANPSGMSQLLRSSIMLPPALILAFGCCKLFLHLKDAKNAKAGADRRP
ncbi:hypothetical protein [Bradyrhizobium sp. CB3481]|uniref:hypothetical protein n=1 Tax=Bradyrhizobium sp. CB3481 TaxID=3039158 RepID=UPI0024B1E915|nr:hypothetical protein [Bradyrhizobium sp. CB3481]WFU18817.1 hypothetical protein QA643_10995 [Bradyrhizobium sp. CB3481]